MEEADQHTICSLLRRDTSSLMLVGSLVVGRHELFFDKFGCKERGTTRSGGRHTTMEEADQHTIRTLLRRDTSNLMLVVSLMVVVVSRAAQEGWRREDAVYMTVLGALAVRYALSRAGAVPMRVFEVSGWYTAAFAVVMVGGYETLRRIPGMKAPL